MALVEVDKAVESALAYFKTVLRKEGTILGVEKTEDGWKVELEAIDYRGAGFDPTLGLYIITIGPGLDIVSYRRTHLRRQSQLTWSPAVVE